MSTGFRLKGIICPFLKHPLNCACCDRIERRNEMKFQIQSRERYCRVPLKFIVRRWRTLSPDKGCSGRTKRPPLVWSLLLCCAALRPRIFYFHDTSESVLSIYLSINVQMCYVLQMLLLLLLLPCHRANCIVQRTWFEQLRFVYCLWNIKLSETRLLIKTRSGWPASLSTCVVCFNWNCSLTFWWLLLLRFTHRLIYYYHHQ